MSKKKVEDVSKLLQTVAREEIRSNVTAEELIEQVTEESDGHKANQEYFDKVAVDVDVAVNGVTNRIALMIDGTLPSNYKDMATVYRRMSIIESQVKAIKAKARESIIADPSAPDAFYSDGSSFTLTATTRNVFDKKLFQKDDPVTYAMIYNDPKYKKMSVVNKLSFKAIGGS